MQQDTKTTLESTQQSDDMLIDNEEHTIESSSSSSPPQLQTIPCEPALSFVDYIGHERYDEIFGSGTDHVCNMWVLARVDNVTPETQDNYINRLKTANKNIMLVRDPSTLYVYTVFTKEKDASQASVFATSLELNEKVQKQLNIAKPSRMGPRAKDKLAEYVRHLLNAGFSDRVLSIGNRLTDGFDIVNHFLNEYAAKKNSNETQRFHQFASSKDLHHVMSNGLISLEHYWQFQDYKKHLETLKSRNRGVDMFHPKRKPRTKSLYSRLQKADLINDRESIEEIYQDETLSAECREGGITVDDIFSFIKIRGSSTSPRSASSAKRTSLNGIVGGRCGFGDDDNASDYHVHMAKKRKITVEEEDDEEDDDNIKSEERTGEVNQKKKLNPRGHVL